MLRAVTDDAWVELLPGTPRRLPDGRLLHSVDVGEQRRVWIDDHPVTPPDVLVRAVEEVDGDSVIAQVMPQVGSVALARLGFDGSVEFLSDPAGVVSGAYAGGTLVLAQQRPTTLDTPTTVHRGGKVVGAIGSVAANSPLLPPSARIRWARAGCRPRCSSRPGTFRARAGCPYCWTPTAGRTVSGSSTPRGRT